jgi:hypothetical protein
VDIAGRFGLEAHGRLAHDNWIVHRCPDASGRGRGCQAT